MKNGYLWVYGFVSVIWVCFFSTTAGCSAKRHAAHVKKKEQQVDQRDPIYKKLFKDTTLLRTEHGIITAYRYKDKIYFEMPVDLLGRDFLLKSVVSKSSHLDFAGMEGVPQRYLTIERKDTIVLYRERINSIVYNRTDSAQAEAIERSKGDPVFRTFRIEGYTRDSSKLIYEVTDFYKPSNKEIFDLKNKPYAPLIFISSVTPNTQTSFFNSIRTYDNSVMIENTLSASFELNLLGVYAFPEKQSVTLRFATYLMLLPHQKMQPRIADQNVGTGVVPFYDYRPLIDVKWKYYVTRHRLEQGKELVFYIDTLIDHSWRKAIEAAAGEWNKVFEHIGLGSPLKIRPYPEDTTFLPDDPSQNVIFLSNSRTGVMKTSNIIDPRTGEIISSHISLSHDAAATIRNLGLLRLSAVDERFRTYFLSDDAICESVKGVALRTFGYALGLSVNYAGSSAYTPQQIRSAEFTKAHGFTASVMDDVLYNTLAQPGDKEKGVSLVIDRAGTADALALQYLYGDFGDEKGEEKRLKAFVRKHEGDPRYLYIGEHSIAPSDPRGQTNDLGNDPLVFLKNRTENMKYLVNECADWFASDSVPDNFKSRLPGLILQEYYGSIMSYPLSYIGGVYVNDVHRESSLPPYTVVDKSLQKKVVKALLASYEQMDWFNANHQLWQMAGVGRNVTEYVNRQGVPIKGLIQRLKYLSFGLPESKKNDYSYEEYLADMESYLFSDVIEGKPMPEGKLAQLPGYFSGLIALSPSLTEIDKVNKTGDKSTSLHDPLDGMLFRGDEFMGLAFLYDTDETAARSLQVIPYAALDDFTPLVYQALERAGKMLERSKKHSKNPIYRGKMDFFLSIINKLQEPTKRL